MSAIRGWLLRKPRVIEEANDRESKGAPSMERYTAEMHQAHVEAEERKRREAEQVRQEAHDKDVAKRLWGREGGDEKSFEAVWPKLREERRAEKNKGFQQPSPQTKPQSEGSRI